MSASLVGWLVCAQFASVGYYWTFYYLFALIVAGRELTRDRMRSPRTRRRQPARRAGVAGAGAGMTPRRHAWTLVEAARALDVALTRREGRRSVLIDSRTAMNYVMAAPIQAALAADPRVRFYATSSEPGARYRAQSTTARCRARRSSRRARAALKRFDVYLTRRSAVGARCRAAPAASRCSTASPASSSTTTTRPQSSMRRWHRFFFVNRRRMRNFISAGAIDAVERRAAPRRHAEGRLPGRRVAPPRRRADAACNSTRRGRRFSTRQRGRRHSSLNLMGVELVERTARRDPWNVIVKLHDRSRDPRPFYSGGVDWAARLDAS